VLAAGLSSRYGTLKQLDAMGPGGQALMDYAVYDARRAGFDKVVFVIRPDLEAHFRERIEQLREWIPSEYAFQRLDDIPPGATASPSRIKPWGTGHAVLAVRDLIDGPFAVVNADDFYGQSSYSSLVAHFEAPTLAPSVPTYACVGFELRNTLSTHGGVSRGVCECADDLFLATVAEVTNLHHDGEQITGSHSNGTVDHFTGAEIVSTNMWGFTPAIFDMLQSRFTEFLGTKAGDENAEFLIPDAVNDMVATGEAWVKILPADGSFFGVTHPGDKTLVQQEIRELTESGHYPSRLFTD
jgi:hypothetical protein